MKLVLTVNKPRNGDFFTPTEEVRGSVELKLGKNEKITSIHIGFRGLMKVSFTPRAGSEAPSQFPGPSLLRETYILFEESKLVEPEDESLVKNDGPEQLYSINHQNGELATSHLRHLFCRAEAWSNLFHYGHCTPYRVAQEALEDIAGAEVPVRSIDIGCADSRLGGSDFDCNELPPCCLPGYSPAVMLEVSTPYPPVICRGMKADLKIFVHSPDELTEVVGPIQIRSITTRLRSTVTSRIGSSTKSDRMYKPIWHTIGSILVDREKFEVNSGMWQNCSTPDVPLSFQAFAVSQTYAIEVILGVSSNIRPEIQYMVTAIDVVVIDPPPGYGNPDIDLPPECGTETNIEEGI